MQVYMPTACMRAQLTAYLAYVRYLAHQPALFSKVDLL
jgi:hypothetical protein